MENAPIFDVTFTLLEKCVNQTTIKDFGRFLSAFPFETKWIMCSDYCIGDKNKPNDVVSFVIFPYILDLRNWKKYINGLQKTDLKNTQMISDEFCKFTKSGLSFSINYVLGDNGFFCKLNDRETLLKTIDEAIIIIHSWQAFYPNDKRYMNFEKDLNKLKGKMKAKSFNVKRAGNMITICFLAAYVRYLVLKETTKEVEMFSWLSDRGAVTNYQGGIYKAFYEVIARGYFHNKIRLYRNYTDIVDLLPEDPQNNMFYDELVRVADIYCGIIADYDISKNSVSKEKHKKGIEKIWKDNHYLSVLYISENNIARGIHSSS